MRHVTVAVILTIALIGTANAQTYGGEPDGWWSDGEGTITNCRSCMENWIQGDIMQQRHEAEQAARARALYDRQIERRLEALEGREQHAITPPPRGAPPTTFGALSITPQSEPGQSSSAHGPGRVACDTQWGDQHHGASSQGYEEFLQKCMNGKQ